MVLESVRVKTPFGDWARAGPTLEQATDATSQERMIMSDEAEIQRILNICSDGASRRDFQQVLSVFVPEAVWEVAGTDHRFVGYDQLLEAFHTFTVTTHYLIQMNAPGVINVDG